MSDGFEGDFNVQTLPIWAAVLFPESPQLSAFQELPQIHMTEEIVLPHTISGAFRYPLILSSFWSVAVHINVSASFPALYRASTCLAPERT